MKTRSRHPLLALACGALALAASAGVAGDQYAQNTAADLFADSMVKMMDRMGLLDRFQWNNTPSPPLGAGGMGSAMNPLNSMNPMNPMGAVNPMNPMSGWGGGSPWSRLPSGTGANPWAMPGQAWQYGRDALQPRRPTRNDPAQLPGTWVSNEGAVLLVRDGLARLYLSKELHQDYYLKIQGDQLLLRDASSGAISRYEFAVQGDRLALRDKHGETLLFRRAARPSP